MGVELQLYSFFNFVTRFWGGFNATPPALHLRERDTVRIVQVAGWAPRTNWRGTENRTPSEIRSPDQPSRSQSQEYLSCDQYLSVHPTTSISSYPSLVTYLFYTLFQATAAKIEAKLWLELNIHGFYVIHNLHCLTFNILIDKIH